MPKRQGSSRAQARRSSPGSAIRGPSAPPHPPADDSLLTTLRRIAGPPAFIRSDQDANDFESLRARLAAEFDLSDPIEQLWCQDLADFAWAAVRYRSLIRDLLAAHRHVGLEIELELLIGADRSRSLAQSWRSGDEAAKACVEALVADDLLSWNMVDAQSCLHCLPVVEKLEALGLLALSKRDRVLSELLRRRSGAAAGQGCGNALRGGGPESRP